MLLSFLNFFHIKFWLSAASLHNAQQNKDKSGLGLAVLETAREPQPVTFLCMKWLSLLWKFAHIQMSAVFEVPTSNHHYEGIQVITHACTTFVFSQFSVLFKLMQWIFLQHTCTRTHARTHTHARTRTHALARAHTHTHTLIWQPSGFSSVLSTYSKK